MIEVHAGTADRRQQRGRCIPAEREARGSMVTGTGEVSLACEAARGDLVDELAVRIRGSSIPGRVLAGSYSVWPYARVEKGDRQFWVTYWAPEVLVIDTSIPRPRRIVLETPDQLRLVSEIEQQAALARSRRSQP